MSVHIVGHFKDGRWQEIARYYGNMGQQEAFKVVSRNREVGSSWPYVFTEAEWKRQSEMQSFLAFSQRNSYARKA